MPELSELHRDIVPKCAARWRDLGVELKIQKCQLDAIAADNANHPSCSEQCCKAVLQKWMEITPNPTWNMIQKATDNLSSLSCGGSSEGNDLSLCIHFVCCSTFVC